MGDIRPHAPGRNERLRRRLGGLAATLRGSTRDALAGTHRRFRYNKASLDGHGYSAMALVISKKRFVTMEELGSAGRGTGRFFERPLRFQRLRRRTKSISG